MLSERGPRLRKRFLHHLEVQFLLCSWQSAYGCFFPTNVLWASERKNRIAIACIADVYA